MHEPFDISLVSMLENMIRLLWHKKLLQVRVVMASEVVVPIEMNYQSHIHPSTMVLHKKILSE
jgi:hypothetical protein